MTPALSRISDSDRRKWIMRANLTLLLLVTALMQVYASSFAQSITLSKQNIQLSELFKEIKKQTGYDFLYNRKTLLGTKPINIVATNMPLKQVLDSYLPGEFLTYTIDQKTIIIKKLQASFLERVMEIINAVPIHGKIVDEKGEAMPGVTVIIKGNGAVLTDVHGEFNVPEVEEQANVTISFIGYKTQILKSAREMGVIRMEISVSALDQVQVIGYGTTSKRFNTGSVSTIKAEDIQNEQVVSPIQALQGMVAGLFIQQSNGNPGAISKVMLRGTNSITSGTTPLYIIDGVPFEGTPTDRNGYAYMANLANGANDPLNAINPADIESIDVLKDADATSIYGSRGANGVIIITTKRAKGGKMSVEAKVYSGFAKVTKLVPLLSTAEYIALRKQAFANDGIVPNTTNAPDLTLWSQTDDTNYEKYLIGNQQHFTDANLSLSQGDAKNGFLISGAYHHETMVLPTDFGYNRGSMHARGYLTSPNGKLKVDFSTIYSADKNKLPTGDVTATSVSFPNNYPIYNPDGSLNFNANISSNPVAFLRSYYDTEVKHLTLNTTLSYNILNNLKFKVNLGDDNIEQKSIMLVPASASNPATATSNDSFAQYSSNNTTTYIVEPQIDYNTQIARGKLSAILGGTYQYRSYVQPYFVVGGGFASDALLSNLGAMANTYFITSYSYLYKYASVFGRVNYNWDGKYILSATYRRDGSSKFGPGKQYGNFASVGAAWIFTEEAFMKNIKWLSFGKLRGSYGTVGNDQISAFGYLDSYTAGSFSYGPNATTSPSGIANPNFSWEATKKLEAAIELGFANNTILVNLNWFRNKSDNLLANYPLSSQTGFNSYTANLDAVVKNTGLEFEVKTTPISTKDVRWDVGFNISGSSNKLVSFPGLSSTTYAGTYVIGKSLNLMSLYNFTGFVNGVAQIEDINKDGQLSAGQNGLGDYIAAGTTDPKFYGGLSNSLKFKNFQLDVFINFTKQMGYGLTSFPGFIGNQNRDLLNSQFKPSTSSTSDSYTSFVNYYVNSTAKVEDASYIRLRNVTLSYNLPDSWLKAMRSSICRIFFTGQNLLTLTKYTGFDPETQVVTLVGSPGTLPTPVAPPLRSFTAGIQFSF